MRSKEEDGRKTANTNILQAEIRHDIVNCPSGIWGIPACKEFNLHLQSSSSGRIPSSSSVHWEGSGYGKWPSTASKSCQKCQGIQNLLGSAGTCSAGETGYTTARYAHHPQRDGVHHLQLLGSRLSRNGLQREWKMPAASELTCQPTSPPQSPDCQYQDSLSFGKYQATYYHV